MQVVRFGLVPAEGSGHFFILASGQSGITTPDGLKGIEIGVSQSTIIKYITERVLSAEDSATYPAWVPRLVRQKRVTYSQVGHGEKLGAAKGRMEYLKNPFLHFNFSKGWTDWFDRHNRYSSLEAKNLIEQSPKLGFYNLFSSDPDIRRRALRVVSYRLPFRPWLRFFYVYFIRLGFLDGKSGSD